MDFIFGWLHGLPPELVYAAVLLVVGMQSFGVPLPGEITLTSAALLATQGVVEPWIVWMAGATGAIVGDSCGYYIGRTHGHKLFRYLGKRFPRHFGPRTIRMGERAFQRYGVKTVFFGRFIDILRIIAGPLAGSLKMPYQQFLRANASGGIIWSGIVVWGVYYLGVIAEQWLHNFSWILLVIALSASTILILFFRKRIETSLNKRAK